MARRAKQAACHAADAARQSHAQPQPAPDVTFGLKLLYTPPMPSEVAGQIGLLLAQAALGVLALRELHRFVFPALAHLSERKLVLEVWAPLAIVAPWMSWVWRVDGSVQGPGGLALVGPVLMGWMGLTAALLAGEARRPDLQHRSPRQWWPPLIWSASGLLLLLQCAAHEMTVMTGQCTLAAAAVLMWINAPLEPDHATAPSSTASLRAGLGLIVVMLAGIGQGLFAQRTQGAATSIAGGLMFGFTAMAMSAAVRAGGQVALQIAGWAAAYGVLLALGLMSLRRMLPAAVQVVVGSDVLATGVIADGFGVYAPEACALLLLAGAGWLAGNLPARQQRVLGGLLLVLVALLAAWRLSP